MSASRTALPCPKNASELLDQYFLEIRCHLLEAAAGFDRIERGEGGSDALQDPRAKQLLTALEILKTPGADRAERFLNEFSE